jgi:nicotinate-nucleotide pyrophosphorylase (carboxylating)
MMGIELTELEPLVRRALDEDLGSGDLTTQATVPAGTRARARITQKQPGVLYGLDAARLAFALLDPGARFVALADEGVWRSGGPVLDVEGEAAALLGAERTALNLLQRLSGVATLTARYVEAIRGTGARVLDTRKTTPGLRMLEKAAVAAGGGTNHRIGLFDAVLIKENHAALAGGVGEAVRKARAGAPRGTLVEVECRDDAEVDEALAAGAERILLDNMSPAQIRDAVEAIRRCETQAGSMGSAGTGPAGGILPAGGVSAGGERVSGGGNPAGRDGPSGGRITIEVSGGVTLETVREKAIPGVDLISVGALTHSAPALDLALELELIGRD